MEEEVLEEVVYPPEETTALATVDRKLIKCPCCRVEFYEGEEILPLRPDGDTKITLMRRIRQKLNERARKPGAPMDARRLDEVAEAFIAAMEDQNYQFFKEFIEREEGKVATNTNIKTEGAVKLYAAALPIEGDDAP